MTPKNQIVRHTKNLITIITPAFNRANYLVRLYLSLKNQTCKKFNWIVFDDGSSDNTSEVIGEIISESSINLQYVYQKNSGKHVAVNKAVMLTQSELVFVVDSDDELDNKAIEIIYRDWEKYKEGLIGISYLRRDRDGRIIGDSFSHDYAIDSFEKVRLIDSIVGDKAEIWKREALYCNPFLEFDDEVFFSEQYSYLKMSGNGKMLFRNEPLYIGEYLSEGLSSRIRSLQWENPFGTLSNAIQGSKVEYGFGRRVKSFLLIFTFSLRTRTSLFRNLYVSEYGINWLFIIPLGMLVYIAYSLNAFRWQKKLKVKQ